MKVFKQIVKEFWIQTLISLLWASYCVYEVQPSDRNLFIEFIKFFGTALFLLSWFFGQYVRIKKQIKLETNFENIDSRLNIVVDRLDNATKEIVSTVTGGDSYVYFQVAFFSGSLEKGTIMLIHEGDYPCYDIHADIADLNVPGVGMGYPHRFSIKHEIAVKGHAVVIQDKKVLLDSEIGLRWNIFITTRGSSFVQQLRMKFVGDTWIYATRVERGKDLLFERIDDSYPKENLW